MTLKIYHNPRCSKSRQTLALLLEHGHDPEIVQYLNDVPSEAQIKSLIKMLGFSTARGLMRKSEQAYKDLGLKGVDDEAILVKAMSENPKLIERPIVVKNGKAALGRPPENVLTLF
ncbi:MAG: arsenate reductase (glutaredoxin) [Acidimicrobiales bacterium]|nr:MAG: arsenate reductase (glutaredoxin) [Acidimicrobiales bacterium]